MPSQKTASSTRTVKRSSTKVSPVHLIPLGGEQEIGKNTWAFQYEDDLVLLDAGLAFPDPSMHGVNIVLPDMTYVKQNRDKIRGMIVTHGHEDHIGGIPYHLREFDIPVIYGPKLALALLREKLKEVGLLQRTELRTVEPRQIVPLGKRFYVEFIRNTHSFADSFTVALHTPAGVVIQTGDFKIDHTPVDGEYFDLQKLAEHGEKGVLCLISDSTNAEVPGFTPSESSVLPGLTRAIQQASGRVIITTFASSVHRINLILQAAEKQGRVVSLVGRSMLNVVAHARQLGYIRCRDETLQPMHVINQMDDSEVVILTTGSQGESLAAMTRIANGEYPHVQIKPGDTVVFSANPIPGNTIAVTRVIDKLMALGAHVVYGKDKGIHVSGHGSQEDQKLMIALTKPKFFVPTHGEYRMLVKHAETAMSQGIPQENIVIINNGDVVAVDPDKIEVVDKIPSGIQLIDSSQSGVVVDSVLKERQQIATEGMMTVSIGVDETGRLLYEPRAHVVGLVADIKTLTGPLLKQVIQRSLDQSWSKFARTLEKGTVDIDWAGLQDAIERGIRRFVKEQVQGKPTVVLMMQYPDTSTKAAAPAAESSPEQPTGGQTPASRQRKRRSSATAVAS